MIFWSRSNRTENATESQNSNRNCGRKSTTSQDIVVTKYGSKTIFFFLLPLACSHLFFLCKLHGISSNFGILKLIPHQISFFFTSVWKFLSNFYYICLHNRVKFQSLENVGTAEEIFDLDDGTNDIPRCGILYRRKLSHRLSDYYNNFPI